MEQYGTIRIKLAELIEDRGISKNKLSHRAEMHILYWRRYGKAGGCQDHGLIAQLVRAHA